MNKKGYFVAATVIWIICVGSLLGIHSYMHKRPKHNEFMAKAQAIVQSLDGEQKTIIAHYEGALLRLNDESYHLIGVGHETEDEDLISNNRISIRKIDLRGLGIQFLLKDR